MLRQVNRSGGIRAGEIAQNLGLARPTVYRLLLTLEELGYVVRSSSDDRYRVTRLASSLGDGYDARMFLCEAAGPYIGELGKRLVWPVDLTTYENAAMIIQETTHARSPLSIDRGMIGQRLPLLRTSAGRAYLAFCPNDERDIILRHLVRIADPADHPFLEPESVRQMVESTRRRGYGLRSEGEFNPRTSSIAVPVVRDGFVAGCISVIWIRTAMTLDEAVTQFSAPLMVAAQSIPIEI